MPLINSDDDRIIVFALIIGVLFFYFILPEVEIAYAQDESELMELMTNVGVHNNKCSRDCCRHTQWLPEDMKLEDSKDGYVGSNLTCDSGCLCVKEEDLTNLSNRGGNRTCSSN